MEGESATTGQNRNGIGFCHAEEGNVSEAVVEEEKRTTSDVDVRLQQQSNSRRAEASRSKSHAQTDVISKFLLFENCCFMI